MTELENVIDIPTETLFHEGTIMSVRKDRRGRTSGVIRADGPRFFDRGRYFFHEQEFTTPARNIHAGMRVRFLLNGPDKAGQMMKATCLSQIGTEQL